MIRNATALTDQVLSNATAALVGTLQERTHALTHPRTHVLTHSRIHV